MDGRGRQYAMRAGEVFRTLRQFPSLSHVAGPALRAVLRKSEYAEEWAEHAEGEWPLALRGITTGIVGQRPPLRASVRSWKSRDSQLRFRVRRLFDFQDVLARVLSKHGCVCRWCGTYFVPDPEVNAWRGSEMYALANRVSACLICVPNGAARLRRAGTIKYPARGLYNAAELPTEFLIAALAILEQTKVPKRRYSSRSRNSYATRGHPRC